MHQTPHIVLATFGTHGDLHPFMALALALQRHGARVTLAAAPDYRDKIETEGLAFAPMRPDMQAVMDRLGMDEHALTRRIDRQPQFLLTHIVMPALREAYEDIMAASTDADALVTHSVAYGAKLAAEQRGLPDFSVALQPMVLWSIHDPPIVANAQGLSRWVYRRGPALTRAFIGLGQRLGRRWARPVDDLRRALGLPPSPAHPLFEGAFSDDGVLALFSPLFAAPQPDHPPHTDIVGFAFHDREAGVRATLDAATTRFLQAGPPPLVFTQGTSAVHDAEDFVRESLDAVRMLGIRAVFVLDEERATRWAPQAYGPGAHHRLRPVRPTVPRGSRHHPPRRHRHHRPGPAQWPPATGGPAPGRPARQRRARGTPGRGPRAGSPYLSRRPGRRHARRPARRCRHDTPRRRGRRGGVTGRWRRSGCATDPRTAAQDARALTPCPVIPA